MGMVAAINAATRLAKAPTLTSLRKKYAQSVLVSRSDFLILLDALADVDEMKADYREEMRARAAALRIGMQH